jgi:formylglycine-generating enzyme required for sulfatase activity
MHAEGASPPVPAERAAEDLYSEYLRRPGGGGDFSAFCARHPEHELALRFLHSFHGIVSGELGGASLGVDAASVIGSILAVRDESDAERAAREGSPLEGAAPRPVASKDVYATAGARRFRVLRRVGSGGMSVVYEARDDELDRSLALKVLAPRGASREENAQLAARFFREARITARLDHPGIVSVHELGVDPDGQVFFTMPLVRGRTLDGVLEEHRRGEGGWTLERLAGVLVRVCQTLSFAHSRGIIHRDVKPSNVMVGAFGEVFVMDWGLARCLHGAKDEGDGSASASAASADALDPLLTRPGLIVGTPAFMPPEQAAGAGVDELADVYAVGAILYALLAGRTPYVPPGAKLDSRAVLDAVLAGPPEPIERLAPRVPAELAAICERAMARDRKARYSSMSDLGADLAAYLEGRVVRAHRTGALAEFAKWVRRNRGFAAATALLVVTAVGAAAAIAVVEAAARRDLVHLGDLKLVAEFREEAARIEPLLPRTAEACVPWLARVDEVYGRLEAHRKALEKLRRRGVPRVLAKAADFPAYLPLRARYLERDELAAGLYSELTALRHDQNAANRERAPELVRARTASLRRRYEEVRADRNRIAERIRAFGHWDFASPDDQGLHDLLAAIVIELDEMAAADPPGTLRRFQRRLELADFCVRRNAESWRCAIDAIAAHPAYRGARLKPMDDLVPLGPDPDSGLWEFAHPESGEIPVRGAGGRLQLRDESAIVLVLIPPGVWGGGRDWPTAPKRVDRPYLFSKFELTQFQWRRLSGENPSRFRAGVVVADRTITERHPVEGISWQEAAEILRGAGLRLPHSAQWMHAAAAGRWTRWVAGEVEGSLAGHANLNDRTAAAKGGFGAPDHETWLEDGHLIHAPVGSFAPNGFGLYDIAGNVREWCNGSASSRTEGASPQAVPDDGLKAAGIVTGRAAFGGSFCDLAETATIRSRLRIDGGVRSGAIGVRPCRTVVEPYRERRKAAALDRAAAGDAVEGMGTDDDGQTELGGEEDEE